jgi:hypothetical protein
MDPPVGTSGVEKKISANITEYWLRNCELSSAKLT